MVIEAFKTFFICFAAATGLNESDDSKNELIGKFNPAAHTEFSKISDEFTEKSSLYMRTEAYESFKSMYFDAKRCGIELNIVSATRTFEYQKGIWEKKWNSADYRRFKGAERCLRIMRFSSMPGTSRHHWGTDIDLNSLENEYFDSGNGKRTFEWLDRFAHSYGYSRTYTSKLQGRTGYEEEKWHWSYRPIADSLLIEYRASVGYVDLIGFSGAEHAFAVQAIEDFVGGVE